MTYLDLASAPMSIGRFRVQGTLGRDTSHVRYQAIDTHTGAQVALKCGLPGIDQRNLEPLLKGEWEAAQRLTHPGIQRVLEMAQQDGIGTYLVLESLEGRSLASLIVHGIPAFQGLHLLVQLIHVLESAEKDGLLHGDLRPENLWISPTGTLMVLGFGSRDWSDGVVGSGPSAGSAHMAPERQHGGLPSPSSELFAFAVTAFQVLTGQLPYGSSGMGNPDLPGLNRVLQCPMDMPTAMQRVFIKALDRQPENRYASLHGFISVLIAACPLDEERLEALLSFVDGTPIPVDVTGLLLTEAAVPNKPLSSQDSQPTPTPIPAMEPNQARVASSASIQALPGPPQVTLLGSHAETRTRIEEFLLDSPSVQEFAIYSQGDTLETISPAFGTLGSLAPSCYFQMADSIHAPESKALVKAITMKSQRRGSTLMFRQGPFSIVLLLKPGKTCRGILEEMRTLPSI